MPLISVEDYKTFLKKRYQKDEFDNERDIYYSNILIPAGEKAIKEHLQIDFTSATRTAEQHFVLELSTEFLIPDFFPVTAIASITLDGETVDADNYSLLPRDSTIRHKAGFWTSTPEPYKITYTGGKALERGDRWAIAKFIALMDDEDRANFTSSAEAEESAFNLLNSDTQYLQILDTYRRWTL